MGQARHTGDLRLRTHIRYSLTHGHALVGWFGMVMVMMMVVVVVVLAASAKRRSCIDRWKVLERKDESGEGCFVTAFPCRQACVWVPASDDSQPPPTTTSGGRRRAGATRLPSSSARRSIIRDTRGAWRVWFLSGRQPHHVYRMQVELDHDRPKRRTESANQSKGQCWQTIKIRWCLADYQRALPIFLDSEIPRSFALLPPSPALLRT
jgi:hypothetical protein